MPTTRSQQGTSIGVALAAATAAFLIVGGSAGAAVAQDSEPHAKPAVVRDNATWLLNDELEGGTADRSYVYGSRDDSVHVMGDWDGDGVRTPGVIRFQGDRDNDGNTDMVWYLRNTNSAGPADIVASFGESRGIEDFDTPVVGDWDGDGDETLGVVRPDYDRGVHVWLLKNENTSGSADIVFDYGDPHSFGQLDPQERRGVPVVGDWDGNGTTTPGVVEIDPQQDSARWLLRNSNSGGAAHLKFFYGNGGRLLTGDWDGDGTTTVGEQRPGALWLLRNSNTAGRADVKFHYGTQTDKPLVWR